MFSDQPSALAYFVDVENGRLATPVREHPDLRYYWRESEDRVRLFTLGDAVDAVKELIG
jgi:hypothetical protein